MGPPAAGGAGRLPTRLSDLAYGLYGWALLVLVAPLGWLAVVLLGNRRASWALAHGIGRLLRAALAIEIEVRGELPEAGFTGVVVANHTSFLDACVLFVAFDHPVVFVAGGVLARQRFLGPLLRALGCAFVRAGDQRPARAAVGELAALARRHTVVLFPEGGLGGPPLRRLRLGAFLAAAEAARPVIPVALAGTVDVLAPGRRLLRRGKVALAVGARLEPSADGFAGAHALAERARVELVRLAESLHPLPVPTQQVS